MRIATIGAFALSSLCILNFQSKATSVNAVKIANLPPSLRESSGLGYLVQNNFYSHNDGPGDKRIYEFDSLGTPLRTITIVGAVNNDWEDITQDINLNYMYIGDFGNNFQERNPLTIYRIPHPSRITGTTDTAKTITYTYPDQTSYPSAWPNFDMEAFFHYNGLLYLFTKPDGAAIGFTKLYTLPDQPGNYVATLIDSFETGDRITGAAINDEGTAIVLISHFNVHVFVNWTGTNIFTGTYTKLRITGASNNVEGISFKNTNEIYITDEDEGVGNFLYRINLKNWIPLLATNIKNAISNNSALKVFPNPATDLLHLVLPCSPSTSATLRIFDSKGSEQKSGHLPIQPFSAIVNSDILLPVDIHSLAPGIYTIQLIDGDESNAVRFMKK